jgi:hypothetical protein
MNGSGRRLVQTPRRAAAQLIFYPGRFGNAAPTPPQSSDVACTAHRGERLGPPIATRAEPHNLCTLTAEIESPPKRAESALAWAADTRNDTDADLRRMIAVVLNGIR